MVCQTGSFPLFGKTSDRLKTKQVKTEVSQYNYGYIISNSQKIDFMVEIARLLAVNKLDFR